jgi:hypothetical protein
MPTTVEAGLPGRQRLLARLLRAGHFDAVRKLADWKINVKAEIAAAAWEGERIGLEWTAEVGPGALVVVDGERRLLRRRGVEDLDVTADLARTTWDVVLVELTRGEVIVPTQAVTSVRPDGRVEARGTAVIGFTGGADALVDGWWQIRLRVRTLGWVAESPLRPSAWPVPASFIRRPATLVRADRTQLGAPCVEVGGSVPWLDAAFALRTTAEMAGSVLTLQLPARSVEPVALELRVGGHLLAVEGRPTGPATTSVTVDLATTGASPTGALRLDLPGGRSVPLAMTVTATDGGLAARRSPTVHARLRTVAVRRAAVRVVNRGRARSMRLARRVRRLLR